MTPAFVLMLLSQQPLTGLPYRDGVFSNVEVALDRAQRALVDAATFACRGDAAQDSLVPPSERLEMLKDRAEHALGRQLNLSVIVNSCRTQQGGARFTALLRNADRALDAGAAILAKGQVREWAD